MEKDKTLKKGEKVKNERNELVKMLKEEPQRRLARAAQKLKDNFFARQFFLPV